MYTGSFAPATIVKACLFSSIMALELVANLFDDVGRHAISISPEADKNAKYITPPSTSTVKATLKGIGRMFTWYPVW